MVGDTLFYARRFERSLAPYRKCLELDPTFGAAHTDLARSLEHVGRAEEAVDDFVRRTRGRRQLAAAIVQPRDPLRALWAA